MRAADRVLSQNRTPDDDDSDDHDGVDDHDDVGDGDDGCGDRWRPRCEYVHTSDSQTTALVRYIRQALAARQTKRTRTLFHADRQAGVACMCFCFALLLGTTRALFRRSRASRRAAIRVIGLPYESSGGETGVEASRFWTRPNWP